MRHNAHPHREDRRRTRGQHATPRRAVENRPRTPGQDDRVPFVDASGDLEVGPLAVDVEPQADAADAAERMRRDHRDSDASLDAAEAAGRETGELYGVRTPHAGDPDLAAAEDRDAFEGAERGENWTEALTEHAAESGPAPEEEVVIVDDSDPERGHHATESGDRPVADKGSGGPGGL
ncbi:MAG TPA: hypothetical protein VHE35_13965 [Kofleriaceae bacterium]|nr:hypothetical protein [Kofleriaceae bacterium]